LIYNFENCANVNSKLKTTWKDYIKRGVPFVRNETQKQKKIVTLMMKEEMQACCIIIIIIILATTSLTKICSNEGFISQHAKE